jgi:hypothetical protein
MPIYTLGVVVVYYRPEQLPLALEDEGIENLVVWMVWILGAALGAVLALSALFLAFYLLYSPFYLARNLRWFVDPGHWIDQSEFRFYLCCFVLLCLLVILAVWKPELAFVVFTLLAGSGKLLARVLL